MPAVPARFVVKLGGDVLEDPARGQVAAALARAARALAPARSWWSCTAAGRR